MTKKFPVLILTCVITSLNIVSQVKAASFTIVDGQIVTTQQTLTAGEMGIIDVGGQLNVANIAINNAAGDNVLIINKGRITTSTNGDRAIRTQGNNASITNNGTISTTGNNSTGIRIQSGTNSTAVNTGSITTIGSSASGIRAQGDSATINNTGTIQTTGNNAHGIRSQNNSATITNTGTIRTSGNNARGIRSQGDNDVVTNSGTIIVTGTGSGARGIQAQGNNSTVINSGTITVTGAGAGIFSNGAVGTVNNSGTVTVSGGNEAIGLNGTQTLNNSGSIIATGASSEAIDGNGGDQTLNLLSGSSIIGTIDLSGGTDTVNISGANNSSTLTLTNVENINLLDGNGVVVGGVVTTVDPTGSSVNSTALTNIMTGVNQVLTTRMTQTRPLAPVQLATTNLTPGMLFQQRAPTAWGQVFGSHHSRKSDGLALAYDHDYSGFVGGYERDYKKSRVGVLTGFALADTETDLISVKTDTDTVFMGIYAHLHLGSVNITGNLLGGFENHNNNRFVIDNLNGMEVADAEFDSYFISPSVTLSAVYEMGNDFELRPSANVTYSAGFYESYSETGTTRSNLSIEDRTVHALTTRFQLAGAYVPAEHRVIEIRGGITGRFTDDDDIDANLAGTNFRFSAVADNSILGAFLGANVRFAVTDRTDVNIDLEYGRGEGGETNGAAHLGVNVLF